MIADVGSLLVFGVFGMLGLLAVRDRFSRLELNLLVLGLGAHLLSALAQVWITLYYYEGGDMLVYHEHGALLANAMQIDPVRFVPGTLRVIFHQESELPWKVWSEGNPTGTMVGIAGLSLLFAGGSLYGACGAISVISFYGQLAMYVALRKHFAPQNRTLVLVSTMLVPSAIFWSSAIIKEAIALAALGVMVYGADRVVSRVWLRGFAIVGAGGVALSLVKPYILFPFMLSFGVWFYWATAQRRGTTIVIKPVYLVVGAGLAIGGVALLGVLFPRYAFEKLGEGAAYAQDQGAAVRGGSYYQMGDPTQRTLGGQLVFAPFALLTALFRPLIFEVRNVLMLVSVIETMMITIFFVRAVVVRRVSGAWRTVTGSPVLMFSFVFVITFGVAVGLATTNLGTLSRYRMPLMPFFALIIAGLARESAGVTTRNPHARQLAPGAAR